MGPNPFSGFFQGVGNVINSGVQDVKNLFNPAPTPPPADAAVVEAAAAQASHPATKAALHQVAANTYKQMAGQNSSAPTNPNSNNISSGQETSDAIDQIGQTLGAPLTVAQQVLSAPRSHPGVAQRVKPSGGMISDATNRFAKGFTDPFNGGLASNPDGSTDPFVAAGQFFGSEAMRGSPEGGAAIKETPVVGADVANKGEAAVASARESINNARQQPGGLQAGRINFNAPLGRTPGEPVQPPTSPGVETQSTTQPLPQEPTGTSVQFSPDGKTETIVPPGERTNPPQYSQEPAQTDESPAGPQFQNGQPAMHTYESTAPVSPEFANGEDPLNPSNPSSGQGSSFPKKPLPGGDVADVPQDSVDFFNSKYITPNKTAQGLLRAQETAQGMLAHMKGGMDITKIEPIADEAISTVSKMNQGILDSIDHPLPTGDPGGVAQAVLDNHKTMVNPDVAADIVSDINAGRPTNTDANSLMTWVRDLEGRAAMARQDNTYLTYRGNKQVISNAFTAAAKEVMKQIDTAARGPATDAVKTPENLAKLDQLSPRLGQQVRNADNVSDMRTSIKDFVPFSKIAKNSHTSQNSTFGRVAKGMENMFSPDNVIAWAANPHVMAGKWALGKVLNNFKQSDVDYLKKSLGKSPEDMPTSAFSGKSGPQFKNGKPVTKMGKGMKTVIGGGGLLTAGALGYLGAKSQEQQTNAYGGPNTENSQNQHNTGNISSSFVKSQDGSLSLPTTVSQPSGQYMTDDQRRAAEANLTNLNDPDQAQQYKKIEDEYQQGQARANAALPGKSTEFMKNAPQYVAIGNGVKNDIATLNADAPNILNKFKTWQALQSYASNPNNPYASQLADLDALNNQFSAAYEQINGVNPGENQLIQVGDSSQQMQEKWTKIMNFIGDTYKDHLEAYQAITTSQGAQKAGGGNVAGPTVPPPADNSSDNASSIVGGSPQMAPQFYFQSGQAAFPQQ